MRSSAKLLVARRGIAGITLEDRKVSQLPDLLSSGDLLILNDSRVVPCRFFFPGEELGGSADCELFLVTLRERTSTVATYEALSRPKRLFRPGKCFSLSASIQAEIVEELTEGRILVRLSANAPATIEELLEREASVPIPPYIRGGHGTEEDRSLYQTVYAKVPGSVAAPTAGLHFTPELLSCLQERGIEIGFVTLHVGLPSILPVERGVVTGEWYCVSSKLIEQIEQTQMRKGCVAAVGTTVVRALESFALERRSDVWMETKLFIQEGHVFQLVEKMMTNFHQPESTHLSLVSAFAGGDVIQAAYEYALQSNYRFLSYGDAMLLDRCASATRM